MADWGAIKKAINSKFDTMPLDKMLGMTLLNTYTVAPNQSITIQNVNGFAFVRGQSANNQAMMNVNGETEGAIFVNNSSCAIIPLAKSKTYTIKALHNSTFVHVYQLGGVFLKSCFKTIKRLIHSTPSSRRVVLA